MDLLVAAVTFGTIFVVELPDKTFIATLVLATRYRPLLVWIGVGLAFAVQTGIAVAVGGVASLLPAEIVQTVAMLLFLGGAVLLLKEAREARAVTDPTEGSEEYADRARDVTGLRVIGASFLVLFAAEWGDLSQLLTISLVARYQDPLSVFAGALLALLAVSGLAVLVGRALLTRVRLPVLYTAGAVVCLGLAAFTAVELFAGV